MAQINPPPSEITPTNFTGRSQGRPVDRTGEILFGGLADALTGAVGVADQAVRNRIEDDVYNVFDEQTESLLPLAEDFTGIDTGVGDRDVPEEIVNSGRQLKRLQNAHTSGVLSDTAYYTRLEAESKRLRAKYPGYRDVVDSTIQSVTGVRPANALRRALMSEMSQLNANAMKEANRRRNFLTDAMKNGYITWERAQGKSFEEIESIVFNNMSRRGEIERFKREASAEETSMSLRQEKARIAANQEANLFVSNSLLGGMSTLGANYQEIVQQIETFSENPETLSPDDLKNITGQLRGLRLEVERHIDAMLAQPAYSTLEESDRKAIRENALTVVDSLTQAIGAEDWTLVKQNANLIQAIEDQGALDILDTDANARLPGILKRIGMPEEYITIFGLQSGSLQALPQAIARQELMKMGAAMPDAGPRKALEKMVQGRAPQEDIDATFNQMIEVITQPGPANVRANMARKFFLDETFMAEIDPESRKQVFFKFASRDITKSINELSNTDPSLWDTYTGWVERNAVSLFQEEVNTVAGNVSRAATSAEAPQSQFMRYNPDTNEFELPQLGASTFRLFSGRAPAGSITGAPSATQARINYERLSSSLEPLNQLLRTVEPIVSEEGGDMSEFAKTLFSGTSIDVDQIVPSEGEVEGGTGEEEVRGGAFEDVFNEEDFDTVVRESGVKNVTPTEEFQRASIEKAQPISTGPDLEPEREMAISQTGFDHAVKGNFSLSPKVTEENYNATDPKLRDIIEKAAAKSGLKVQVISAARPGDPRRHGRGQAIDIQLFDASGTPIPNYQNARFFREYEKFAQIARLVQQELYPELDERFTWGGYFSGGKGKYGALDTMHFDLGGTAAGGSWDTGLTDAQKKLWKDVDSKPISFLGFHGLSDM